MFVSQTAGCWSVDFPLVVLLLFLEIYENHVLIAICDSRWVVTCIFNMWKWERISNGIWWNVYAHEPIPSWFPTPVQIWFVERTQRFSSIPNPEAIRRLYFNIMCTFDLQTYENYFGIRNRLTMGYWTDFKHSSNLIIEQFRSFIQVDLWSEHSVWFVVLREFCRQIINNWIFQECMAIVDLEKT